MDNLHPKRIVLYFSINTISTPENRDRQKRSKITGLIFIV